MAAARTPSLLWLFFSLRGRIARQSYILASIFNIVLLTLVIYKIGKAGENEELLALWGLVFLALALASSWSALALTIKRLHDLGYPWPLVICLFIPVINWLFVIFLMVKPSQPEANEHGPPPFPGTQA